MTERLVRMVWDGPGRIVQHPHVCDSLDGLRMLATPAASIAGAALSVASTGVGVYNAFQLARQEDMLRHIGTDLERVGVDVARIRAGVEKLQAKTDFLIRLVNEIRTDVKLLKDLAVVEHFLMSPLDQFARSLDNPTLDLRRAVGVLQADIRLAYAELVPNAVKNDADIALPAYAIERYSAAVFILHNLNRFLLDLHNDRYPSSRQYFHVDSGPNLVDNRAFEEMRKQFTVAGGKTADGKVIRGAMPLARTQWLISLRWEVEHLALTLHEAPGLKEQLPPFFVPVPNIAATS